MLPHLTGGRTVATRWTPAPSSACARATTRYRWSLEVDPGLVTGGGFLFGGCGLGAAISALEGTSGRPVRLGHRAVPLVRHGRRGGRHRRHHRRRGSPDHPGPRRGPRRQPRDPDRQRRARAPAARRRRASGRRCPRRAGPAEDCPPRPPRMPDRRHDQRAPRPAHRRRVATWDELDGTPGDGQALVWARIPDVLDGVDATALAVLGDYVPMGVGPGARHPRRRQQPRQHAARRPPRAHRVGAARHPGPRRRARLRPRPRAHVRRGRHAAGHGQPELHRAVLGPSPRPPTSDEEDRRR